ncbi:glycosyltransferase [Sphingomonas morindae]|uniref:Glycosyltransferase n=1 Tax=Sphingomonas morindae TaxID=1541170 RepID=A0ABY4X6E8_9SPHN|nr:glycosyltransferase [Sphingomonas morindae]USI72466.1 glycosyltransferase [Sphingomonas morindae]
MSRTPDPRDVAVYLPDLSGGGAERLHVRLAGLLPRFGYRPRFLLDRQGGALMDAVPPGCRVDALAAPRPLAALPKLIRHLRADPPGALIVNTEHMAVIAAAARAVARVPTKLIITQHNAFGEQLKRANWQWKVLPPLYRRALAAADAILCVSSGVADDLAARTGLARSGMDVIYNGVVDEDFETRAAGRADHPFFAAGPVILAMGRMVPQKDFATLVDAFARFAPGAPDTKLIILGEGPLRPALEAQIAAAGLADRIALPGFVDNPLPWLRAARLFVLSSRFEGFGNVLAEALACGTPVASTNCPFGPDEILEDGRFGPLVPVGDAGALAEAMARTLAAPLPADQLRARGQDFTVRACARHYATLLDRLQGQAIAA